MVLGVVADGLDELVGACVEGDGVLGVVILCRGIRVRRVYGDVREHLIGVLEHGALGVSPAGEGLALDGRCLDAECVLGEGGAFLPGDSLDAVSVSGVERHRGVFFFSLRGSCRILILGSISHCYCGAKAARVATAATPAIIFLPKDIWGNPFLVT